MTANGRELANAIALYIDISSKPVITANRTGGLSIVDIENAVDRLSGANLNFTTNSSFIMSLPPSRSDGTIVVGATFQSNSGGQIVLNGSEKVDLKAPLSVGAILTVDSLKDVQSLNILLIDKPVIYINSDNSTNKSLASSVVVASIKRNSTQQLVTNISLYFQVIPEYAPTGDVIYLCSFYDTNQSQWSESGCSKPTFNSEQKRYECTCDHLTSFGLIWLPASIRTSYDGRTLRAADIASLVFQSVSILCFLGIIVHTLVVRLISPIKSVQAVDLLPLIACASTIVLFIFYIALGMTVYTRTTSQNETQCFLSSAVLMFVTYFFLIFMFCVKTSVGYFNFLRFVYLFPQPSFQQLWISLLVSFFVSVAWLSVAIGLNSKASLQITQLYPYRLCWFTTPAIYYFLTIPVCLFLVLNGLTIFFVSKRIIAHARNASSPHQSFTRAKRCVLILLSSCVTQGIGWLLGPFISFVDPTAGNVLEWFFIVFNGLEGLWSILLYITVRAQRLDEKKRVTAALELTKSTDITKKEEKQRSKERKTMAKENDQIRDSTKRRRSGPRERSDVFDDLRDIRQDDRFRTNDRSIAR